MFRSTPVRANICGEYKTMTINEKAAFLKGLVEGSDLSLGEKEQKVFAALLDLVSDMAQQLTECDEDLTELYEQVASMDDELGDIEDDLDLLFDDADYDDEDECDCCGDDFMYDVQCPACEKDFSVDEDTVLGGEVSCPFCGEKIEFDLSECCCGDDECDCHEHGCDCGCCDEE